MGRTTASEEIYNVLRNEILSLRFAPGQELNVNSLALQLNCSRSPVRDALMRLDGDNLVDIFPQKGTRVSLIDLHQVEEERFLRKSLELSALANFIGKANASDFYKMEAAIERQKIAAANQDFSAFFDADDDFHKVAFDAIGKNWCWSLVSAQSGNYHRIRLLSFQLSLVTDNIITQHQEILSYIREGRREELISLVSRHLEKLDSEVSLLTEKYGDYFKTDLASRSIKPKI
jgi:Transcriptional regulators